MIDGYREVKKEYGVELVKMELPPRIEKKKTTTKLKVYSMGEVVFTWIAMFMITVLGLLAIAEGLEAWAGYLMMFIAYLSLTIQAHAVLKQKIALIFGLGERAKEIMRDLTEIVKKAGFEVDERGFIDKKRTRKK